ALKEEKTNEDHEGYGYDVVVKHGGSDFESLDSAQDGDCGSQHGVTVKERRTEDPEPENEPADFLFSSVVGDKKRKKREDASLALVIRPHNVDRILKRDNNHERPENEGEYA